MSRLSLCDASGPIKDLMEKLSGEYGQNWLERLKKMLRGELADRAVFTFVAKIDRDMTGWTCVEPAPDEEGEFEPFLYEFLRDGETRINGEEMIKRSESKAGLRYAEAMLRSQEKIPVEWRKFYLVFPEVWQYPHGDRYVWSLYFYDGRWYLYYYWLGYDFSPRARLVGSCKC